MQSMSSSLILEDDGVLQLCVAFCSESQRHQLGDHVIIGSF
jgi:hypothetical protein